MNLKVKKGFGTMSEFYQRSIIEMKETNVRRVLR